MVKNLRYFLPTMGQSWICALMFIAGQVFAGLIVLPLSHWFPGHDFIDKTLAYLLSFIPVLIYAALIGKSRRIQAEATGEALKSEKISDSHFGKMNPILFFIIIACAALSFMLFIDPITSMMKTPEWFEKLMETMVGGDFFWSFLTVAICAPLMEELFCRGLICRGLLSHYSPAVAIIISAIIFAVIHLNPWQAVPAFILGCFYGWIYYKTRCLWATVFLHFINNGISTVITYLFPNLKTVDSFRELLPDASTYWLLVAVSVGVLAVVFFLLDKYLPKHDKSTKTISA